MILKSGIEGVLKLYSSTRDLLPFMLQNAIIHPASSVDYLKTDILVFVMR